MMRLVEYAVVVPTRGIVEVPTGHSVTMRSGRVALIEGPACASGDEAAEAWTAMVAAFATVRWRSARVEVRVLNPGADLWDAMAVIGTCWLPCQVEWLRAEYGPEWPHSRAWLSKRLLLWGERELLAAAAAWDPMDARTLMRDRIVAPWADGTLVFRLWPARRDGRRMRAYFERALDFCRFVDWRAAHEGRLRSKYLAAHEAAEQQRRDIEARVRARYREWLAQGGKP